MTHEIIHALQKNLPGDKILAEEYPNALATEINKGEARLVWQLVTETKTGDPGGASRRTNGQCEKMLEVI